MRRKFPYASRFRIRWESYVTRVRAWLGRSDLARIFLEVVAGVAVLAAILAFIFDLWQREEDRIVRAWTVIAFSPNAKGNIGQKEAVELLARKGVCLLEVNLSYAHLVDVQLPGVDLWSANLERANLERANLRGAHLVRARFDGAVLKDADLHGATLYIATFRATNLRGTNFEEADLRGVDFSGANLTMANLSGADLTAYGTRRTTISELQLHIACSNPHKLPKLPRQFQTLNLRTC